MANKPSLRKFPLLLIIFSVLVPRCDSQAKVVTITPVNRTSYEIGTNLTLVCVVKHGEGDARWFINKERVADGLIKKKNITVSGGIKTIEYSATMHVSCSRSEVYTCQMCGQWLQGNGCNYLSFKDSVIINNTLSATKPKIIQYPTVIDGYTPTRVTFSCSAGVGVPERTLKMYMSKMGQPDIALKSVKRHQQPTRLYDCVKVSTMNGSIQIDQTNENYSVVCEVSGTNFLTNLPIKRKIEIVVQDPRKGVSLKTRNLLIAVWGTIGVLAVIVAVAFRRRCIVAREKREREERNEQGAYASGEMDEEIYEGAPPDEVANPYPPRYEEINAEDMDNDRSTASRSSSRRSRSSMIDDDASTRSRSISRSRSRSGSRKPRRQRSILKSYNEDGGSTGSQRSITVRL